MTLTLAKLRAAVAEIKQEEARRIAAGLCSFCGRSPQACGCDSLADLLEPIVDAIERSNEAN